MWRSVLRTAAAATAFAGAHSALASRPAKRAARRMFGERAFDGLYRPLYVAQSVATTAALGAYVLTLPDRELYRAVRVPVHALHGLESWDERGVALEYEFAGVNPDVAVHLLEAGQFPMYSHPAEIAKHVLQAMALV